MNKKYIGDSPRLAVFGGQKKHALKSETLATSSEERDIGNKPMLLLFNPTALSAKIVRYSSKV